MSDWNGNSGSRDCENCAHYGECPGLAAVCVGFARIRREVGEVEQDEREYYMEGV